MRGPLHTLERRVLETLAPLDQASVEETASKSDLAIDRVRRAVEWLKSKNLVQATSKARTIILLAPEGREALSEGLPERKLQKLLSESGRRLDVESLRRRFGGTDEEFSAALGEAKRLGWINYAETKGPIVLEAAGSPEGSAEEAALTKLAERDAYLDELPDRLQQAVERLRRRPGYVHTRLVKSILLKITDEGIQALKAPVELSPLDALSPELLASGEWRERRLRPIDVEAPAAPVYGGKKHPVQRFIDEVREIFVSLGFAEVEGPLVQPCFWNFDSLFIPQDHPAREMQDTFYLANVKARGLDSTATVRRVAAAHENGANTGSRGWGYVWDVNEAKRLVLRTHTTAVTIKYLSDYKPKEARVFSVGRVFRNEKLTFKNLFEFQQIEGITVGDHVSLRDMMGLLSEFYSRLGLKKVKFWPSYFPYTEPSLQAVVFVEDIRKWVELCGMGIFRPEVTLPLGVKSPVLAWGGGLERLVMLRYGIDDIRKLYENNLGWLRRIPLRQ